MSNQEAIEVIKLKINNINDDKEFEAFDMAINALENQIPKEVEIKPVKISDDGIVMYDRFCPNCRNKISIEDYCPNCGQAIRWEY